jgi:hypothetical protein
LKPWMLESALRALQEQRRAETLGARAP